MLPNKWKKGEKLDTSAEGRLLIETEKKNVCVVINVGFW